MGDFDFNTKYPISEYVSSVFKKKQMELADQESNRNSILSALQTVGQLTNDYKNNREAEARALSQAALLAKNKPELADAFGASNPVATRQIPLPEGTTGPMNQVPVDLGDTQTGKQQVVGSLAKAIKGITPDQLLNHLKPVDPLDALLKKKKIEAIGDKGAGGQLRQNAFTGEWEWYFPPSNATPGAVVPPASGGTPKGTFRDVSKAVALSSEDKSLVASVSSELDRIKVLNKKSRGGLIGGLIQKGQSMANVKTDSPEFKNTADVVNTLKGQVSRVLKSTFGGQLSDSERAYLNEVYGAVDNYTPAEREIAMTNVATMLRNKSKSSQSKLNALTGRSSPAEQSVVNADISSMSDEELRKMAGGQ